MACRLALALLVLGCMGCADVPSLIGASPQKVEQRRAELERGIRLRFSDPAEAVQALQTAGTGSELETLRMQLWFGCLERSNASSSEWRRFIDQDPPQDLLNRARIVLGRELAEAGETEAAFSILDLVVGGRQPEADVIRLGLSDPDSREQIALRLAVFEPVTLRREAPDLEKSVLTKLQAEERIQRAVRWRESGHPRTSAAELRSLRLRGELGRRRNLELALSELDAGSTSRAITALPKLRQSNREEALVLARCWRLRGWSRVPRRSAATAFGECLSAARWAGSTGSGVSVEALELQLECGTEAGRLDLAHAAWTSLEQQRWRASRRSWLGRRLGVALIRRGVGSVREYRNLAAALPDNVRCLYFWMDATARNGGRRMLPELDVDQIPDLYALWDLDDRSMTPPISLSLPVAPVAVAEPPPAVVFLLDLGEDDLASQEWRRVVRRRAASPAEAVAAALHEDGRGRPDLAIRGLRREFPGLGSISMTEHRGDAVRSYLPLRWPDALRAAAREAGIQPWLLAGLARQESIFNATARSPAGALGVVQLLPSTARGHARALGLGHRPDLTDPTVNLRIGARELAWLIKRFGAVEPALAAYNAGETRVRKWWREWPDPRVFTEKVPIPETYTYIRRVRFLSEAYRLVWAEEWTDEATNRAQSSSTP